MWRFWRVDTGPTILRTPMCSWACPRKSTTRYRHSLSSTTTSIIMDACSIGNSTWGMLSWKETLPARATCSSSHLTRCFCSCCSMSTKCSHMLRSCRSRKSCLMTSRCTWFLSLSTRYWRRSQRFTHWIQMTSCLWTPTTRAICIGTRFLWWAASQPKRQRPPRCKARSRMIADMPSRRPLSRSWRLTNKLTIKVWSRTHRSY